MTSREITGNESIKSSLSLGSSQAHMARAGMTDNWQAFFVAVVAIDEISPERALKRMGVPIFVGAKR